MLKYVKTDILDRLPDNAVVALSTVRNEMLRLPYFLEYYRYLGVDAFIFIDNNSDDGTTDFLMQQEDAVLLWTNESYRESRAGVAWMNEAIARFAVGRWCLTVDTDELLVFHGVELVDLKLLCRYLDGVGSDALFTMMVDCYGAAKLAEQQYEAGAPFLKACPYFDGDGYFTAVNERFPYFVVFGGMRRRMFFENGRAGWGPALRKVPLVKWRRGMEYVFSTHALTPCSLSELSGALLHFKFLRDFSQEAVAEVKRGDRFVESDYRRYAGFASKGDTTFMYPNSLVFTDSSQLVRCGFIRSSKPFLNYIADSIGQIEDRPTVERYMRPLKESLAESLLTNIAEVRTSLSFLDLVNAPAGRINEAGEPAQ